MKPSVIIMHAGGTNRDVDVAMAIARAGGRPEIVHVNALLSGERTLMDHQMCVIPGGFSYGDDLGAGKLLSVVLKHGLRAQMEAFIAQKRPVLGICNGFQALIKSGLLPGPLSDDGEGVDDVFADQRATLTHNLAGRFECRWVTLRVEPETRCVFLRDLAGQRICCPVAHGEGRLFAGPDTLEAMEARGLAALRYVAPDGSALDQDDGSAAYPCNPNGSLNHIAGITNTTGTVLGLMPHPEDHIFAHQRPRSSSGEGGQRMGLALFESAIRYAASLM